jgi:hypothetical protein
MCIIGLRKGEERRGEERRARIRRAPKSFFVIGDVVCNLPNSKLHYLTLHFTSKYMSQTNLTILIKLK